jgi:hypothetical protein
VDILAQAWTFLIRAFTSGFLIAYPGGIFARYCLLFVLRVSYLLTPGGLLAKKGSQRKRLSKGHR